MMKLMLSQYLLGIGPPSSAKTGLMAQKMQPPGWLSGVSQYTSRSHASCSGGFVLNNNALCPIEKHYRNRNQMATEALKE